MVNITMDGVVSPFSVWDPFCHYERDSYVVLFSGTVQSSGRIDISVANSDPDYQKCRREGVIWPEAAERYLKPTDAVHIFSDAELQIT